MYKQKKRRWIKKAIYDFRTDVLLTKGFKAMKISINKQISFKRDPEYRSEYRTQDGYETYQYYQQDHDRRKINYDSNTFRINDDSFYSKQCEAQLINQVSYMQ